MHTTPPTCNGDRDLKYSMTNYLFQYFMYASIEGSGETVQMSRLVQTFAWSKLRSVPDSHMLNLYLRYVFVSASSKDSGACANPESFVRGSPTLSL